MIRLSRDFWLATGLFLLLAVITATTAAWQARREAEPPPLANFSSAPDGGRALRLWLEELDYVVTDEAAGRFEIPRQANLALILEPSYPILPGEWAAIDDWVEKGGILVLAGDGWPLGAAVRHYDFDLLYLGRESPALKAQNPLLASPPLSSPAASRARAFFVTNRNDFLIHVAAGASPVLLSFQQGAGQVILSTTSFPFSNAGLKDGGNSALVLNVVSAAKRSGWVWFDEWHHGVRSGYGELVGPGNWLRRTPAGRSLLFAAAVIFLGLVLQGRRFGRPIPLPHTRARRAPLEYVTAMANLARRAGHRSAVLAQYYQQLKRELGRRYRLDPALPDEAYVAQLALFNPSLDFEALRDLLTRLRQKQVSEHEMVQLAAKVAAWLEEV